MRTLAFVYAVCLSLAGVAQADGNLGLIYGRVLIAGSGEPVCPVTVTVTSDREPPLKTTTSNNGDFYFLAVSPGTVAVTVGRSRAVRYLTISANIANLDLILYPFYLSPINVLTDGPSTKAEAIQRICRGRHPYFSGYGYSDYDPDP